MATMVTLFKSAKLNLSTGVRGHGLIRFHRGRFATGNPKLAQAIKDQCIGDPALRIYIDPNEPEVDLDTHMSTVNLPELELKEYIYRKQMETKLIDSTYEQEKLKAVGTDKSPLTGGPSGTARFTPAELTAATEKFKTTGGAKVITPTPTPSQNSKSLTK